MGALIGQRPSYRSLVTIYSVVSHTRRSHVCCMSRLVWCRRFPCDTVRDKKGSLGNINLGGRQTNIPMQLGVIR